MTQEQPALEDESTYLESNFSIPKMDCPSEENLIRMALGGLPGIRSLAFDLAKRELTVEHQGEPDTILSRLRPLNLGAAMRASRTALTSAASSVEDGAWESVFAIPKMDCASEENLIRMTLEDDTNVRSLSFDLPNRELKVMHTGPTEEILERLAPLRLGASLRSSSPASPATARQSRQSSDGDAAETRTLRLLLAINGSMFLVELLVGSIAQSTGLIADSLDMFADAAVYMLALNAVGRAAHLKARSAHIAGWLQVVLAIAALVEVGKNFVYGSEPRSSVMIGIGLVALVANVTCLVLIAKKRDRGAHMKASYIFSANDVLANLGVVVAGVLVSWTGSPYPDLVIGIVIGVIVLNGARRILQLR
jgi:cation transport ATPase